MANKTISDLKELSTVSDNNVLVVETNDETFKVTKENLLKEVNTQLNTKSNVNHTHDEYVTESELNNKGYLTEHIDISGKANISDLANVATSGDYNDLTNKPTIPSTTNLATKKELTDGLATKANKSEIPSLEGYATETFVTNKIAEASLSGGEVDLSEYATKAELTTKADKTAIPTKTSQLTNDKGYLTSVPSEYVTETELNAKGYLTSHQDISNLALKSEIPDVSSFITSEDLPTVPTKVSELTNDKNYISSVPSEYVTETELNAKGYLTSHQDISGLQTKTDNNLTTTSKEVVGAINEVKDMADLILDTEVRLNKTYSSSKIHSDIQDAIDSSKSFTLNEIGKMSSASYKVVTSTAEMTDGKIIYLLENGATYDMYIVETAGTVTKIGDTAIDLSSYLKVTDAESAYLKKTEATSTYVAQTSFNNHITDTVAHLTQFEKNKLLTTDNITSTINNNSDNTQIPSVKATYDLANTKANTNHTHNTSDIKGLSIPTKVSDLENDRGYLTSIPEVDLSGKLDKPKTEGTAGQILVLQDDGSLAYEDNVGSGTTDLTNVRKVFYGLNELNNAKGTNISLVVGEDNTMKIIDALSPIETFADYFHNDINSSRFGIDANTYGTEISLLTITKFNDNVTMIRAFMSNGKLLVRRYLDGVLEDWQYDKGNTNNDVPKTTLTPTFPSGVVVASGGVAINYIVRNGWCNVNFAFNITSATTFSWTDIATGLPKPANSANIVLMNEEGKINRTIAIKINSTGSVSSRVPTEISSADWWNGNISYPVEELL